MNKILLIGSLPPPIGGVTIHIDRFFNTYLNNSVFELAILDIKKKTIFTKNKRIKKLINIIMFFLSSKLIHIHISNDYIKLLFALLSKLMIKKVVYTHHNSIVRNKFIFKLIYKLCDKIILVNDKEIDKVFVDNKKTEVIPAFLPPYKFDDLPEKLNIEIKKYDKLISTNCYMYNLISGKHVYGFDLIIDAFYKLAQEKKIYNTLLILLDPSNTTKQFVDKLLEKKDFYTNKVLLLTEKIDFVSLVKKSDITIRATRTDGDSLSVRESLYFDIPIVCSDVTIRPKGAIIFKNNDSYDLAVKILNQIGRNDISEYQNIDYGKKVIDLYQRIINGENV